MSRGRVAIARRGAREHDADGAAPSARSVWRHCGEAAVMLLAAAPAAACPNCFAGSDARVLATYYFSTAMLSLLPFALVGGIVAVAMMLRRRFEAGGHAGPPPPR